MSYQQQSSKATKGTCDACGSTELQPARDELAECLA